MPDVFGASGQFSIDALNNQAQNNINNLYTGGGFGAQTNYYSGLGAQYSAAGMSPYGVFSDTGGPAAQSPISYGGGYNTGNQGGGGYAPSVNDPSINWSQFSSGGLGSGGSQPSIDWSSFTSPSNSYSSFQGAGGLGGLGGMFGGLTGSGGAYQGPNNAIDWSNLFGGGGSSQSLPNVPQQQTPAIDWNSFQSPSNNYNTFQGAGIQAPDPTPQAQAQPPYDFSPAPKLPDAQKLLGYDPSKGFSAGGAQQPAAPDQGMNPDYWANTLGSGSEPAGTHVYDFAPMFDSGGGFGAGGAGATGTSDVKAGSLGGDAFTFNPSAYRFDPVADKGPENTNQSPDALAAQARARLASLMGGATPEQVAETAKAVEAAPTGRPGESAREAGGPVTSDAATGNIPLPQARPAAADVPRPPGDVPEFPAVRLAPNGKAPEAFVVHHTEGRPTLESTVADWQANRPGIGSQYFMDRNGIIHDVAAETGYQGTSHTRPGNVQGAEGLNNSNVVGMEISARDTADMTPAQIAALTQFANTRYPDTPFYGHREIDSGKAPDEGIAAAQAVTASRPAPFNFDWSDAPIPDPSAGTPLRPPADIPDTRAAPPASAPHTGLELARANIDTPIEKIAMERGGQKAVDQISFMAMGKTPRELAQSYGGMFMSKAEPLFQSLGITRQDFEKAAAMQPAKQDVKMRFGEGDFSEGPAYTGPEAAPGGGSKWLLPMPDTMHTDIEDRRGELAALTSSAGGASFADRFKGDDPYGGGYDPSKDRPSDPAMDQPLSGNPYTGASFSERFSGDAGMRDFQSPANSYRTFQQGVTSPVDTAIRESAASAGMDPAHWKAIAEIESALNPSSNQGKKTQYKGLYQLGSRASDPEWTTHGMGDIYNPMDNALAAGRLFQHNAERFKGVFGRDPTPGEAYVLHNQGLGFFTRGAMTNVENNIPVGHGFTVPATHDSFLSDWDRYVNELAGKYQ